MAGLDGAASPSFLALLAAKGFWPGGRARPPPPLWPPPARSSPSFPSLLSLSPSSVVLLAPYRGRTAQKRIRRWVETVPDGVGEGEGSEIRLQNWKTGSSICKATAAGVEDLEAVTHKLQHVPVKDVVVGETLSVEEIPEELPEIGVVWLVVEAQRATQVQVGGELGCQTQEETAWMLQRWSLDLTKCD